MVTDDEGFEQWVADEGGPEAVVEMVAELQRQLEAGLVPAFTARDEFLAHVKRRGRRSA